MLKPPPQDLLPSFQRLRRDDDFVRVLDWLRQNRDELDKRNRSMVDGVQLRMGQGAAVALTVVLEAAEGSSVPVTLRSAG